MTVPRSLPGIRRFLTGLTLFALLGSAPALAADPEMTVFMDPNCGCCGKWVDHMRDNGFSVETILTGQMYQIKQEMGVPRSLGSCHTAWVDGYLVEGHVPASDVLRMLEEQPPIRGISAPGMPLGSPGMEGPYSADRYDVIGFDAEGNTEIFASH